MIDLSIELLFAFLLVSAGLSFLKALSGLGAAGILVPIYLWLGLSINEAKAYGLLANATSLTGATFDNLRAGRIDWKLGLPIIVASTLFAPIGAYLSLFIPKELMMGLFAAFLVYVGINALRPRKKSAGEGSQDGRRPMLLQLIGIGVAAGLFSGLLGVGGGGVIAPLMLWLGCEAKKVAVITALAVPFSSMTGFFSYAIAGHSAWVLIIVIGTAAAIAGYAGNRTMHGFLPERAVKYLIGVLSLLFATKIISDMLD